MEKCVSPKLKGYCIQWVKKRSHCNENNQSGNSTTLT